MKYARFFLPTFVLGAVIACSGGSGATFSVLDGVNDDAPTRGEFPEREGYETPRGGGESSSGNAADGGRRDSGTNPQGDSGTGRPVACGTVLQCTVGTSKADLVYDCTLFRADGKLIDSKGNDVGTWTASGTTITVTGKTADGGTATALTCVPKPAGTPDAGSDAAKKDAAVE